MRRGDVGDDDEDYDEEVFEEEEVDVRLKRMRRSPRRKTSARACAPERYPSMVTPISTLGLPSMDSNTFAGCGTRPTPSPT